MSRLMVADYFHAVRERERERGKKKEEEKNPRKKSLPCDRD